MSSIGIMSFGLSDRDGPPGASRVSKVDLIENRTIPTSEAAPHLGISPEGENISIPVLAPSLPACPSQTAISMVEGLRSSRRRFSFNAREVYALHFHEFTSRDSAAIRIGILVLKSH